MSPPCPHLLPLPSSLILFHPCELTELTPASGPLHMLLPLPGASQWVQNSSANAGDMNLTPGREDPLEEGGGGCLDAFTDPHTPVPGAIHSLDEWMLNSFFILSFFKKNLKWWVITLQYCDDFCIHQHESAVGIQVSPRL